MNRSHHRHQTASGAVIFLVLGGARSETGTLLASVLLTHGAAARWWRRGRGATR